MEIKGGIIQANTIQTGMSAKGQWSKQEYILQTAGQYPKKVCFSVWGKNIGDFNILEGDEVEIKFDPESREYNGRWYTEVKCFACKHIEITANEKAVPRQNEVTDSSDTLPF